MKKIVTLLALCICITASAESRRLLTMEEAILSRELIPQNYSVVWSASHPNHFLHYSDSEWSAVNIHTGEASPATAPAGLEVIVLLFIILFKATTIEFSKNASRFFNAVKPACAFCNSI